jgi:hypothetical protein
MINGHAKHYEAECAAEIALEQKPGIVAEQPARFIHPSANLDHAVNLWRS